MEWLFESVTLRLAGRWLSCLFPLVKDFRFRRWFQHLPRRYFCCTRYFRRHYKAPYHQTK